jgi:hypothetical protein
VDPEGLAYRPFYPVTPRGARYLSLGHRKTKAVDPQTIPTQDQGEARIGDPKPLGEGLLIIGAGEQTMAAREGLALGLVFALALGVGSGGARVSARILAWILVWPSDLDARQRPGAYGPSRVAH